MTTLKTHLNLLQLPVRRRQLWTKIKLRLKTITLPYLTVSTVSNLDRILEHLMAYGLVYRRAEKRGRGWEKVKTMQTTTSHLTPLMVLGPEVFAPNHC